MLGRYKGKRESPRPEKESFRKREADPFQETAESAGVGDPFAEESNGEGRKSRLGRGGKIALIVLAAVAGLALAVAVGWKLLVKPPDVSGNSRPAPQNTQGETKPKPEPQEQPGEEGEPEADDGRKEEFFTFLLLGKDTGGGGNTDTMLLVSYDVPNGAVSCMSIPRDTMVNVSWDIKRINSVYASSKESGGGIDGLKKHIAALTGVTPDFHVIVEWEAVGRIVEALGGVWFDVPYTMSYDDPYQDLYIHQEKGYRLLDGEDAMQVIRWRKNNDGTNYGDTTRVEIQQAFLKALAQQCLQLGNWTKVSEFANIFFECVETDIPLNNLLWFAQKAMGISMDKVQFMTLPGEHNGYAWSRTYQNNQSYAFADPAQVVEMVNQYFNPYDTDITEADLQIMYKNKNGSLGVTNGTLADPKAASAPVKPPKPPKEEKPAEPQEPLPPEETTNPDGGEGTTDPGAQGGTATDPSGGGETTGPGTQGGTITDPNSGTATDPGAEPVLPPEPAPPEQGGTTVPEEPPAESGDDTVPPGWL